MDFNLTEMSIEELEARKAELLTALDADGADIDAIDAEARAIKAEIENRKAIEAQKAEIRAAVAAGEGTVVKTIQKEERTVMTNAEIRKSHEYNVAYANYIKTGNDAECRALLTENVSGTVPVAEYVEGRVRTAWDREGITSRVRKTFMKGNVKIGYEISATGAIVHTEAANTAVTEETLTLGIVTLVPESIKKWISISDEVYDLAGEEFLDYIYDELTYRIAKKLADEIIADIEACGTASTGSLPAVPKITATTVTLGLVAQALAQLSDEASNPVILMNKATWGEFKSVQANGNYGYDPFEGLPVVFNDTISAFSAATTGTTYAIVGDLGIGAQANFPNGQEIEIKFDDKTKMEYDLIRILGREYVGHAVVAPKAFVKICH